MAEEENMIEDNFLKLQISPRSLVTAVVFDEDIPISLNPFAPSSKRKQWPKSLSTCSSCTCPSRVRYSNVKMKPSKRNAKKVLKESVLKYLTVNVSKNSGNELRTGMNSLSLNNTKQKDERFGECSSAQQDFKSLLDGCEKLKIGSEYRKESFQRPRSKSATMERPNHRKTTVRGSSCSQQAIAVMSLNPPCDVTIDELASYFETFVHIPKKMSSMAEMMYI